MANKTRNGFFGKINTASTRGAERIHHTFRDSVIYSAHDGLRWRESAKARNETPNTHLTTFKQSEERKRALLFSLRANPTFPRKFVPTQPQPSQLWALKKASFLRHFCSCRKPVPSLQYAAPYQHKPHHLPCFLPRSVNIYSVSLDWSAFICSEVAVKFQAGLFHLAFQVSVSPTSPHGPGFPARPGLRWCRACRRIPGCCVCSGPPSSLKPGSSCPAGTCSTTRQPPSPPNLCPLRQERISLLRQLQVHIYMWLSTWFRSLLKNKHQLV